MFFINIVVTYVGNLSYEELVVILENILNKHIIREKPKFGLSSHMTYLFTHISQKSKLPIESYSRTIKARIIETLRDKNMDYIEIQILPYTISWYKRHSKLIWTSLSVFSGIGAGFSIITFLGYQLQEINFLLN